MTLRLWSAGLLAFWAVLASACVQVSPTSLFECEDGGWGCPPGTRCNGMYCMPESMEEDASLPLPDSGALPDASTLADGAVPSDASVLFDAEALAPADAEAPGPDASGTEADASLDLDAGPVDPLDAGAPDARPPRDAGSLDGGCGTPGAPCCEELERCSAAAAICVEGECVSCGAAGQPCCAFALCGEGLACGGGGTCLACGEAGSPCCAGRTCNGDGTCLLGICRQCGGAAQPACGEGASSFCAPGLTHSADAGCSPCGTAGQPCCVGGGCTGGCCDLADDAGLRRCTAQEQPCAVAGGTCGASLSCGEDCGSLGAACCHLSAPLPTAPACTGDQLVCGESDLCVHCGGEGEACCAGQQCVGLGLVCDEGSAQCTPCGFIEARCCPGSWCSEGCCVGGQCTSSGFDCGGAGVCTPSGECTTCGVTGGACCPNDACLVLGATCSSGVCQ